LPRRPAARGSVATRVARWVGRRSVNADLPGGRPGWPHRCRAPRSAPPPVEPMTQPAMAPARARAAVTGSRRAPEQGFGSIGHRSPVGCTHDVGRLTTVGAAPGRRCRTTATVCVCERRSDRARDAHTAGNERCRKRSSTGNDRVPRRSSAETIECRDDRVPRRSSAETIECRERSITGNDRVQGTIEYWKIRRAAPRCVPDRWPSTTPDSGPSFRAERHADPHRGPPAPPPSRAARRLRCAGLRSVARSPRGSG
jgi:hypothetical protein